MAKKSTLLVVLVLLMQCLLSCAAGAAESRVWIKSSDGIVAFSIEAVDNTTNYPKINITMSFKVDETLSKRLIWTYDASNAISTYITSHPEYKNRKIKVIPDINYVWSVRDGIMYGAAINIMVGEEKIDNYYAGINLWEQFPDDFIDYDAIRVASAIKLYKEEAGLFNPSSLSLNGDAKMWQSTKDPNVIYYTINLNAMNRLGGYVNQHVAIVYNTSTGKIDLIDMSDFEYIIMQGATPGVSVFDAAINALNADVEIWQRTIEMAMN